jgi:pyruvate formate lyase activating enzyme
MSMADQRPQNPPTLEAKSPFEMRVNLGKDVPETDVRTALATGDMGFLHSYTTGSAVDGPGIRVVAWTTGCMWRCRYCHNPDTWTLTNGLPVTVRRAADELAKYRPGLKVMAGGFTLSGGEPLMQHRFAAKLLAASKAMGIHTAIETNGYFGDRMSDADLEALDLVLLGIKSWGEARHKDLTGMDIAPTLAFAKRLAAGLGNVQRVEVLPFHQLGRFKWERLGLEYTLDRVQPPSSELAERTCAIFRSAGLTAA